MTTQIAVKLSDELLAMVDDLIARGEVPSRSAAVRKGLEALVAAHRRRDIDRAFQRGFREHPETDEEIRDAERLAIEAIRDEVWEKWW